MCNLLYRRLVEVPEDFLESPQLEKSFTIVFFPICELSRFQTFTFDIQNAAYSQQRIKVW